MSLEIKEEGDRFCIYRNDKCEMRWTKKDFKEFRLWTGAVDSAFQQLLLTELKISRKDLKEFVTQFKKLKFD